MSAEQLSNRVCFVIVIQDEICGWFSADCAAATLIGLHPFDLPGLQTVFVVAMQFGMATSTYVLESVFGNAISAKPALRRCIDDSA